MKKVTHSTDFTLHDKRCAAQAQRKKLPREDRPDWALCYPNRRKRETWQSDFVGVTRLSATGEACWVNLWRNSDNFALPPNPNHPCHNPETEGPPAGKHSRWRPETAMMKQANYLYDNNGAAQARRCFATLRRSKKRYDWQSDFFGTLALEDGRRYNVGVTVGIDPDGEDVLRIYLDPRHLRKTLTSHPEVAK